MQSNDSGRSGYGHSAAMNIVLDLLPWEPIFLGSSTGLAGMVLIAIARRGRIGSLRWLVLILAIGAALPWLLVPRFGARLRQGMQSNIVSTSEQAEWPELRPRRFPVPRTVVADALPTIIERLGWRLIGQNSSMFIIEVPVAFGLFIDDLQVTLDEDREITTVNAISNSRVGSGDLGENRRHIVQLCIALEQQFGTATQH